MKTSLEKRLKTKHPSESFDPERTPKQNRKIYGDAKGIAKILYDDKDKVSKDAAKDFIYNCAMYAVYNPKERGEITKMIDNHFKEYKTNYLQQIVFETIREHYTDPKYLSRFVRKINAAKEYVAQIEERQKVKPEMMNKVANV